MPVIVSPTGLTYPDLVDTLEGYLNRTDFDTRIPMFISLVEAKLNRLLDDPEMEVTSTAVTSGQYLALPEDFGQLRSINVGNYRLTGATEADFSGFSNVAGIPRTYGIIDGQIAFAPVPATGSAVTIVYTKRIPALDEGNPTNWLLNIAPDIYVYGTLMQAHIYGWNDERVPGFKALYEEAIQELIADAQKRRWGAAPISPRLGRT
jgi:hypothetical protein